MGEGRITMLSMLRCTRMTRTLATRSFRSTPAMFEKLPAQPDSFPAGELINEITGANGLRREEIEAQTQLLWNPFSTTGSSESQEMTDTEVTQERQSGFTCTPVRLSRWMASGSY